MNRVKKLPGRVGNDMEKTHISFRAPIFSKPDFDPARHLWKIVSMQWMVKRMKNTQPEAMTLPNNTKATKWQFWEITRWKLQCNYRQTLTWLLVLWTPEQISWKYAWNMKFHQHWMNIGAVHAPDLSARAEVSTSRGLAVRLKSMAAGKGPSLYKFVSFSKDSCCAY